MSHLVEAVKPQAAGIEISGVNLSYGATHVLKDISLSIRPGEFFAFLGPSGCGKTTLLRLIAGFNTAQSGRVEIAGEDITGLEPWRRNVGMVFQSYALWPHMSVAANVAFGLEEQRLPRADIAARVHEALDLVGLTPLKDRKPSQLSGGQQQRVALARTIAVRPRVLLLDEPLSNLDAKMRVQVRGELRELQQRLGITTIFVTHDQEEANTVCDRIAVMHEGKVQQVGTPIELYNRPATLFVADFLGTTNMLSGTLHRDSATPTFTLADGTAIPMPPILLPPGTPVPPGARLVLRPQDIRLMPTPDEALSGDVVLSGVIEAREFLGGTIRYAVRAAGSRLLVDVQHRSNASTLEAGNKVYAGFDPACAHLLGQGGA